jgi:3-hydroxyisobutyrate dehydrogenase
MAHPAAWAYASATMIAFLGLGLLGANFTRALVAKGESVRVWNRSPDKARTLAAELPGAVTAFDDVAAAVSGATRVHLTLSDDAAVDDVLARALPSLSAASIVVDHTTTSPHGTAQRAAHFAEKNRQFLHAPVFMGPVNARESTGIMMTSGPMARHEAIAPALSKMTGNLVWLGEDPARAAAFKLMGNLFLVEMITALGDVLSLANATGIDRADAAKLFEFFNPGAMLPARLGKLLEAKFDAPSWMLQMARKDVRLMLESAQRGEAPLTMLPSVAQSMDAWIAKGHATDDWTVIAKDVVAPPARR